MEKSPIEMIGILPDEEFTLAKKFIDLSEKLNCKSQVRFAPGHKTWKCVYSRMKPSRVLYTIECSEKNRHVKACLWNIDTYKELLNTCSDNIKNIIKNAFDCISCNLHCKGGAKFTYEKILYKKCIEVCAIRGAQENRSVHAII